MGAVSVRQARVEDAAGMARVHVGSWRATYRGLMPDAILDDPDLVMSRERFWGAALTDQRYARNRAAVAEHDGEVVGIAMSGPEQDPDAQREARQLYLIYLLVAHHGSGAGPALLEAVLDASEPASLWVADPNPRAQAFYRKHGFRPDGTSKFEDEVREIRMTRPGRSEPSGARGV